MDLGTALDIVICLAFIYLLLSMVASTFEEMIAGMWNSRGRGLKSMIGHLLDDPGFTGLAQRVYKHPLVASLIAPGFDVPLLRSLLPYFAARLPSYIPKETFADVICDIVRTGNGFATGQMQPALAALWRKAAPSQADFRTGVIAWFEAATDRQAGTYKRSAQRYLLAYGFVAAAVLNVDTLQVASYLWTSDNAQRLAAITATASSTYRQFNPAPAGDDKGKTDPAQLLQQSMTALDGLGLPIGWKSANACSVARAIVPDWLHIASVGKRVDTYCGSSGASSLQVSVSMVIGWFITAFAISLGAQFWFDTLGKIVGMRSAGKKPDTGKSDAGKPAANKPAA